MPLSHFLQPMQQEIRNIAIIAHVDHGKTTLTDALMQQCGVGVEGQTMDSNPMEKERGITITAKIRPFHTKV
jgi:GTP-binding protein